KERYNTDIQETNILLQGLPKVIYTLINHYTDEKDIWDNVKMLLEGFELTKEDRESPLCQGNNARGTCVAGNRGAQNRVGNVNPDQARNIKCYNYNGGPDNTVDEDVDEPPVQDLALMWIMCFKMMNVMHLILMLMRLPLHRPCSWKIYHPQILFMMKPIRHMI
nr:integrase, catalytic region, zinc finger, CCHC-type, peptidase aspartic, catalytic [Tanacetum cinerariifolium]